MNTSLIDVNVYLSRWPTRRLREDQLPALIDKLQAHNIQSAWAASFEGVLHEDIAGVNARLAQECRRVTNSSVRLLPVGTINPMLPDWPEDVRRCAKELGMHAIRLHPNYHAYKLDDPVFARVLELAGEHKLLVTVAVQMEDERTMHPLLRVKPVDLTPLETAMKAFPQTKVLLLNCGKGMLNQLIRLVHESQIYVDIATFDGLTVIEQLVKDLPLERILLGSHAPLFYVESAILKLKEAALSQGAVRAIQYDNARALMP